MRQVIVSKRTAKTYRPELALAAGPLTLAQTGAGQFNDLYGAVWALALYRDGTVLLQLQNGAWIEKQDSDALAYLSGARHVALSFDQAARPVIAWEVSGKVYVRQWSPQLSQYATRGPFLGRDPLLFADTIAGIQLADADLLLLYLEDDQLKTRVQRESYAVARILAIGVQDAVLDQIVSFGNRWQVLGERINGELLVLKSELSPLVSSDSMLFGANITNVVWFVAQISGNSQDVMSFGANINNGVWFESQINKTLEDSMSFSANITNSVWFNTQIGKTLEDAMLFSSGINNSVWFNAGVLYSSQESLAFGANITNGVWS